MRTVIITGANSGLGFETAKKIAKNLEYQVILSCRNLEKAENAKQIIIKETGNQNIKVMKIDTSSLASVRAFADEFLSLNEKIDVLINNAGISPMAASGLTDEGFEVVFATNYLGHFLLTQLLLPTFKDTARIINITSDMHNPPGGGISWPGSDYLAHPQEDDRRKYSYSKLCMIYFSHKLDRVLKEKNKHIIVNSFNPGFMADTNFSKGGKAREAMIKISMPDRFGKLETSSSALADVATLDELKDISGAYFDRSTKTIRSSELSYNQDNEEELWQKSLEFVGLAK